MSLIERIRRAEALRNPSTRLQNVTPVRTLGSFTCSGTITCPSINVMMLTNSDSNGSISINTGNITLTSSTDASTSLSGGLLLTTDYTIPKSKIILSGTGDTTLILQASETIVPGDPIASSLNINNGVLGTNKVVINGKTNISGKCIVNEATPLSDDYLAIGGNAIISGLCQSGYKSNESSESGSLIIYSSSTSFSNSISTPYSENVEMFHSINLTLPSAAPTVSGNLLSTNVDGKMSWVESKSGSLNIIYGIASCLSSSPILIEPQVQNAEIPITGFISGTETTGSCVGFTFETGNNTPWNYIESITDFDGTHITITTDEHDLVDGQIVNLAGTVDYDGYYIVEGANIPAKTFRVAKVYTNPLETDSYWIRPSTFKSTNAASRICEVSINMTINTEAEAADVVFYFYKNTISYPVSYCVYRNNIDFPSISVGSVCLMTIAPGDIIYMTYKTISETTSFNITASVFSIRSVSEDLV